MPPKKTTGSSAKPAARKRPASSTRSKSIPPKSVSSPPVPSTYPRVISERTSSSSSSFYHISMFLILVFVAVNVASVNYLLYKGGALEGANTTKTPVVESATTTTPPVAEKKKISNVTITALAAEEDNVSQALMVLDQEVLPGSTLKTIDANSAEGKKLVQELGVKFLPVVFLTGDVANSKIGAYINEITQKQGDKYILFLDAMRLPVQKRYLVTPTISERDKNQAKGPSDAKVTIIEFSDFQCPFCAKFYEETYGKILEKYQGKVRFIFKHLPLTGLGHANAPKAAEAFECAADQKRNWEMHDKIFANQTAITVPDLKKYAGELQLVQSKFDTCLDSGKYATKVSEDSALAAEFGIHGTPGFFINNKVLEGAYPFDAFDALIQEELKK